MKTVIIGAGGVGGYFGAKIARAGNEVTFVARGEQLKAMQANGLTVKSIQGDFKISNLKCSEKISEIGPADLVILAVKAWQVKDVALQLKSVIDKDTVVMPVQNGVLAVDELKENLRAENVIGGLCRIMSKIESPGVINHFGIDPVLIFGETNYSVTVRLEKINEMLSSSGINASVSGNIDSDLWKKFIPICVSGLLAVSKTTYGELREMKETRKLMVDLIQEIYLLSQKIGIPIEPEFPLKTIAFIDSFPPQSTSSLTRDVWEGKPSEIPVNSFVYSCILPMEYKARNK